ncbi:transmembrane protein 102 [Pleurodeles waltl]
MRAFWGGPHIAEVPEREVPPQASGMASSGTAANSKPAPARPLTDLDFRSAARIEDLNKLVQEFGKHEMRDYDDQRALEVHSAKDFIFSMLGLVQKLDHRLPVANEYLLLSGGIREGVLDMDPDQLGDYARGTEYDLDFTLLVPALKLHDRNQPVTLDMRQSSPCHTWLSLHLFDAAVIERWRELCCEEEMDPRGSGALYFSPTKVADWFFRSVASVLEDIRQNPQRGMPRAVRAEQNGQLTTVILTAGSSRILYDLVPVVSFKGWPAVAQGWLSENHFWDGKITEEEVIGGFYLVPSCSRGGLATHEWRLAFSRSEVQLKKCIPTSLLQAFQACKAIIVKLLSRPRAISPYHLRTIMLWACDRLPTSYLLEPQNTAHFLLGLVDDLNYCLLNKCCPNFFLPQCNMFEHLSDETAMLLARKLSSVRAEPAEHLSTAIEHAKAASKLHGAGVLPADLAAEGAAPIMAEENGLARKIKQLVTENQGKSISVYLNPDDVTRPHFRINDKFF